MSLRKRIVVVALCGASMFTAGMWIHAQTPPRPAPSQEQQPTVLSGNDIGFRVDTRKGGTLVGKLVVRVNGQWVEVEESVGIKRLTAR